MVNNQKICGFIGLATKAGKIVSGTDACLEQIEKRNIKILLLANDAADRTKKIFKDKCKQFNIEICETLSVEEISNSIGKNNKAVVGVKDKGFAQAILKIINGGEMIGENKNS